MSDKELPAQAGSDDWASLAAESRRASPVVAPMSARADGDGRASDASRTVELAPAIATNAEKRTRVRGGKRAGPGQKSTGPTPLPAKKRRKKASVQVTPIEHPPLRAEGGSAIAAATTTGQAPAALEYSDTIAAIVALGRRRRFLIKSLIRQTNSVGAYVRSLLGWRLDLPEAERAKIAKRAARIVTAINKGISIDEPIADAVRPVVLASDAGSAPLTKLRDETEAEMIRLVKTLPVYPFAASIKGFARGLGLAVIVAEAGDIGSYKSRSALWKRMGLAVIDGERQGKRTNVEEAARHGYNPHRRAEMYAVVAEPLLKHQWRGLDEETGEVAHAIGPYGERYGTKKAEYTVRVEATKELPYSDKAKWTPKRANEAAKRYMTKCLLRDLFGAWKAAHRLPDTEPYQMAA